MNVGSLFSGIGGLDLGLERAGHRIVWQCESDEYRRAVLRGHFPGIPCAEDVREVATGGRERSEPGIVGRERSGADGGLGGAPAEDGDVDLICGGFPCQDVSVAGRRAGLAGERSGLFFEFARIIDAVRPGWVLIENVPGLLSSHSGRDFATIIDTLDQLGYVGAWRILDSRFFGVPQRRRRVFILTADASVDPRGERCREILAVGTRCNGHSQTGGETGQGVAASAPLGAASGKRGWRDDLDHGAYVTVPLGGGNDGIGRRTEDDPNLVIGHGVRRLTPRECERLQGFPDDWTLIDWNGKPATDSRRYAALGDAVTVNVAEWIGRRLGGVAK